MSLTGCTDTREDGASADNVTVQKNASVATAWNTTRRNSKEKGKENYLREKLEAGLAFNSFLLDRRQSSVGIGNGANSATLGDENKQ